MTLAVTPNVKRLCSQLALARRVQKITQTVCADAAGLSVRGLTSLYAGRGNPSLHSLDALTRLHGLGHITVCVRPERIDAKAAESGNILPLIHMLNMEQSLRDRMRQRTIRAESRFVFTRLGMGHRTLSDRDVHDIATNINASAVAGDVKSLVLNLGGICLRNHVLKYDGGTLDLNEAVPVPFFSGTEGVARTLHQGRGQDNAEPNDVPTGDTDDVDDSAEQALWDDLMNSKGA